MDPNSKGPFLGKDTPILLRSISYEELLPSSGGQLCGKAPLPQREEAHCFRAGARQP